MRAKLFMESAVMRNFKDKLIALAGVVLLPVTAFATPDPYAGITAAIDFDAVGTVVAAAGAALALVFVLRKGVRLALGMIK